MALIKHLACSATQFLSPSRPSLDSESAVCQGVWDILKCPCTSSTFPLLLGYKFPHFIVPLIPRPAASVHLSALPTFFGGANLRKHRRCRRHLHSRQYLSLRSVWLVIGFGKSRVLLRFFGLHRRDANKNFSKLVTTKPDSISLSLSLSSLFRWTHALSSPFLPLSSRPNSRLALTYLSLSLSLSFSFGEEKMLISMFHVV